MLMMKEAIAHAELYKGSIETLKLLNIPQEYNAFSCQSQK
jgi:hypothetical protein